jgi:hypothetical protein
MPQAMQKNAVQVLAAISGPPGRAQPNVTLNAASQSSILTLVLNQKINTLMTARARFVLALQHNPPSPMTLTAALQGIDAEVNLCLMILSALANNTPIQFPSQAQMAALAAAVHALGTATAQGAATVALIAATSDVIATFPG